MKAILSLITFDVTNSLRDSMVLYILVAPLLIAGGVRLFLPSMEGSLVRFAVEAPAGAADGRAVTPAGRSSVGTYTIVQSDERSPVGEYAAVGLVMLASLIGGLAVAFAMIDEKEQKVTQAFAVTPLSPAAYFAARGILAAAVGIVVAVIGHAVLVGAGASTGRFFIALLACAPLPLVVALLVGGIAKNQIQALATLKVVMVVYLTIPFASIAVRRAWHWVFRTFENLYVTGARAGDSPLAAVVNFVTGFAALALLGAGLGKQLKPR